MARWDRHTQPRADEDYDEYVVHGFGGIGVGHSFEVTEDEERELRKERRRAEQRRKPWPESRP